jgi:glycopeptide antibiotics resistance protein
MVRLRNAGSRNTTSDTYEKENSVEQGKMTEKQVARYKKLLVLLPAVLILLWLFFDYIWLPNPERKLVAFNRLINLFPFLLYVWISAFDWDKPTWLDAAMQSAFHVYLYAVLVLTLFFVPVIDTVLSFFNGAFIEHLVMIFFDYYESGLILYGVNLNLFEKFATYGVFHTQVIGNFFLLFPLGFFLAILFKVRSLRKVILITLSLTLFIELSQFLFSHLIPWSVVVYARSFDVDDILLNTLGGVAGYLSYLGIRSVLEKKNIKIPGFTDEPGVAERGEPVGIVLESDTAKPNQ